MNKDTTSQSNLQERIPDWTPSYAHYMMTATDVERNSYAAFKDSYEIAKRLSQSGQSIAERGDSLGLSTLHTVTQSPKPSNLPPFPGEQSWGGSVELWRNGSVARVKLDTVYRRPGVDFAPYENRPGVPASVANDRADNPRVGGKRGDVVGFSKHSRRRLLRECGKIDRGYLPTLFTLTFADDKWTSDPEQWKRALRNFYNKLQRKFGEFCGFWRVELKDRKSGARIGEIAPHFHCVLFLSVDRGRKYRMNKVELEETRAWCDKAWNYGMNRVESVRSANGTMAYLSKYVCKQDSEETLAAYPEGIGRVWGVWGREENEETGKLELPVISEMISWVLPYEEAQALMRAFKREIWGEVKDSGFSSLFCFVDAETFLATWGDVIEIELALWAASLPVDSG